MDRTFKYSRRASKKSLLIYRLLLAAIALCAALAGYFRIIDAPSGVIFSVSLTMLFASFISSESNDVVLQDGAIRYQNRVYPFERIDKIRVRRNRRGEASLKVSAKGMDVLRLPLLCDFDELISIVCNSNPEIEVIR